MSETTAAPQVDEAAAPEVSPADDLRAALSAAYDELAGAETQTDEPAAQQRDEHGRFVARERDASAVEDHETPAGEPQTEAKPDEVKAQAPEEARPALPPELVGTKAVLDEYRHLYAAKGVPAEQAVKALFEAEVALRQNPEQAFPALAQAFGFDMMKWAQQRMQSAAPQQNAQAAQPADPAYQALLQKVEQLEASLTTQQQQAEASRRAQVQAQEAQISRQIAEFAADPKHAHFQAVEPIMAALISTGQAKDMPAAYEMACRAHPEVSKAIAKADAAAREKAAAEAQRKAAVEAKAKTGSVRGSPALNGFTAAPESLRGVLEAAFDGRLN